MVAAGMNVARLNLSHGSLDSHAEQLHRVRQAASAMQTDIAIMADTRGREIRTCEVKDGSVTLERGQSFVLYGDHRIGNTDGVSITQSTLHDHVKLRERILLDDGQIELLVTELKDGAVRCSVECGGVLGSNKGVNLPDSSTAFDDIDADDRKELEFAVANDVEYIAASFVRTAGDVEDIRSQLSALGADIPIITKIESRRAVENLESIISVADGIMVARGDLGVELRLAQGPTIQKKIIRATVTNGKPVITATQMLDSMERNPRPTRAEVSDVANAIFDGTSAVMLSGETAIGAHPVEAVRTMVALALEAEAALSDYGYLQQILPHPSNVVTEAVAQAAITMANHLNAAAIVALTETGFTSRLISKYRPTCPILAVTSSPSVVRRLAMNWGVQAMLYENDGNDEDRVQFATQQAKERGFVRSGDIMIVTAGSSRQAGSTDLIRVLTVD